MSNRRNNQYIEPDNTFYEPSRDKSQGTMVLVVLMTILFVALTTVLAVVFFGQKGLPWEKTQETGTVILNGQLIPVSTPTPTPVPPMDDRQNPILYPASASMIGTVDTDLIDPEAQIGARGLTETIISASGILNEYSREDVINMGDPLYYGSAAGILTYRGNNFRNCASYGFTEVTDGTLTQTWEFSGIGSRISSTYAFEWSGVAWTGQPIVIRWDSMTRSCMNLFDDKRNKEGLVEVIVGGLDGKVYFFDLADGSQTRNPIDTGSSIKGTPAVDPRGYPILYVGQGDDNGTQGFGMRIYSLIDSSLLYFCDGMDDRAYRSNWGACDSSPLIDGESDTLIWPSENGIIYTFKLNTTFNAGAGALSMSPVMTGYKYIFADEQGNYMGVEGSIAVYGGYGYFCDNDANLICLDLNTMQMMWQYQLADDSDLSPVIAEENGTPFLYIGTEVDNQGETGEYCGAAYTYKFNALTGQVIWQTSQPCHTYNGESSDSDQTGGCLANPIIGKGNASNLVIFSYSMTSGLMSGNRIVAYDKTLGNLVWSYDMNIYSYSSPVDCYDSEGNCYIVICDSLGQIHLIDGQTGERINYIQTSRLLGTANETTSDIVFEASPVVFENTIIVGTKSGSVFAVEIG